ncbi:hypothetical protein HD806DRAFT_512324 [Xylariaceae sp. AK1471]|nr:hypothetical protein HD806DRAFT_512324 [Xylariaceae sp. AK1471]
MSIEAPARQYFVNDEDYRLWLSVKDELEEVLHLKAKFLVEYQTASSADSKKKSQGKDDKPLTIDSLRRRMKRVSRVLKKQQKLVEAAQQEMAEHRASSQDMSEEIFAEDVELSMRWATIQSELSRVWSVPKEILESDEVKEYVIQWKTEGSFLQYLAEGRIPPEEDMVTQVGDYEGL